MNKIRRNILDNHKSIRNPQQNYKDQRQKTNVIRSGIWIKIRHNYVSALKSHFLGYIHDVVRKYRHQQKNYDCKTYQATPRGH